MSTQQKSNSSSWKAPSLSASASLSKKCPLEAVGVFQSDAKKPEGGGKYDSLLQKFKKSGPFNAAFNSHSVVWFGGKTGAESVLFTGLGSAGDLTEEKFRILGGSLWTRMHADKADSIAVQGDSFFNKAATAKVNPVRALRAMAEGFILAAYHINHYKSSKTTAHIPSSVLFVLKDKAMLSELSAELKKVAAIGDAVRVTRDWSNEPSNYGTPEFYAAESVRMAKAAGLKCTILTEKDAAREKMGLFLGVGQGAEREGRIVVLEYTPKGIKNPKTVCLVGKGVTFDSGGISIKPSMKMEDMKHDMTGAATLMGSTLLAASWKVPTRVVTILAFTENMPDGNAIQPGNVLTSRPGKTVEIINTDAEGRLILADVLDYAHEFKPDAIIDAATLTGAVAVALGKHCCGILGNDAELIEEIQLAGEECGERIWQLPLYDEYFDDLKSDYADMKNSANDPYGGTIRGAIFLKQFIRKGMRWAHLDIAAMAYGLPFPSYMPRKGASGAYVRSVAHFLERFGQE